MKYIIMSKGQLEGFQRDHFTDLSGLFLSKIEPNPEDNSVHAVWNYTIGEAMVFDTERAAWDQAYHIWGMDFSKRQFVVVAIHEESLQSSREKSKEINKVFEQQRRTRIAEVEARLKKVD